MILIKDLAKFSAASLTSGSGFGFAIFLTGIVMKIH
jgi:hypothetical protein